ncbi:unnamed protein product [Rotaria magnacalcarata]|uniref:Uncharacterized protein n=11 Tax=Rotaria magnacalcarata TaxID=392030 RepID=A0A820WF99_9BILA|nr:unnamed protein product [Rotaria magnacalcarata]CAF2117449.1 unnamed protein product [Rotaria magnacalcarata]CAF2217355.1 unnamed protein product [Rotaria magnacalcarata]CAF3804932.1 unnamed protein product [Rotaria magnacalcarata]CAF4517267.1 unnamed protein product [Rotaria magnacalcarata]
MNAALALIFFACVAGSMASDARGQIVDQLLQQGQVIAQSVMSLLQQQLFAIAQQAIGQVQSLIASIGRFDIDFNAILNTIKPLISGQINQVLAQLLGSLQGLIGGRASFDFAAIFQQLLEEVKPAIMGLGQHILNQGLSAVLGGLSSLGQSRAFSDIFASISSQVSAAVTAAQGAVAGALNNLVAIGSGIVDASKPHFQQLQEQLIGHGLNALGSLSETINNLHGSVTGGR